MIHVFRHALNFITKLIKSLNLFYFYLSTDCLPEYDSVVRQISTNVADERAADIFKVVNTMLSSVMMASGSSETAAPHCQITLHHIPQNIDLNTIEIFYPPGERCAKCWPPVKF